MNIYEKNRTNIRSEERMNIKELKPDQENYKICENLSKGQKVRVRAHAVP